MNNNITLQILINRLNENHLDYETLDYENGMKILITKRGARIFGPYENLDSVGVMWVNGAFKDASSFESFLDSKDWNLGGDRVWVAPEFPFFNKIRADFFNTYTVQNNLDPGTYNISKTDEGLIRLEQKVALDVYESDIDTKEFSIKTEVMPVMDPLRCLNNYSKLIDGIKYCGYELEVELTDLSPEKRMPLEVWSLSQINPGGFIYVPYNCSFEFVDYCEPIDDTLLAIKKNYAKLRITGDRRYKIGYKSAIINGRAGYMNKIDDQTHCLFIKNYFNNPSSDYCCEPFDKPGERGCSLYVYNDSGDLGGFAEFECSGNTIGAGSPKQKTTDKVINWFYLGSEAKLKEIAGVLLGIECFD